MTIYGWDASHYDAVPSGAQVVAEGFAFMTHKAGGDANDAELASWWSALKGQRGKLLLGAYWVLRPDTSGSAVDKANAFCDRLDSQCPGWGDTPFILQVDCEKWNGNAATVPSKSYIKAFCDRLVQRAPKLRPIVYAPEWVYGDSLTGLGYPLWASNYVSGSGAASKLYPGDSSSRWGAYSGQTPAILQFTSSATIAGQTTCDANAYRGTLAQLTALVAPGWESDMAGFDKTDLGSWANTDGVIDGPSMAASVKDGTNPQWTAGGFLRDISNYGRINENHLKDVEAKVDALAARFQQFLDSQTPSA